MTDEYISRAEAVKIAEKYGLANGSALGRHTGLADCIASEISGLPAADVAPVRHGRWIHTDLAAHWYGKDECSECTYHEHDRRDLSHFNYCPNCGARMDGGGGNSDMS